jgi:hypothetical protein
MARKSKTGEKFGPKYGVVAAQFYKNDPGPSRLKIPGPDHFLYDPSSPTTFDEIKVQQIDEDGQCTQVVEVWTDSDNDILWVVDGRETLQNVREANRRRAEEKRELVELRLIPFKPKAASQLAERDVVAHLAVRNFHRRLPTPSSYALNILLLRKKGWEWSKVCQFLHVTSDDPEQWCKKRLPIAHCIDEVRAAFDSGKLSLAKATKFGGRAEDGSWALSRKDQLALLDAERAVKAQPRESRQVTPGCVSGSPPRSPTGRRAACVTGTRRRPALLRRRSATSRRGT